MSSPDDETDETLPKVIVQKCNSLDSGMTGSSGSSDSNDKTSDEVEEEEEEEIEELAINNPDAEHSEKMPYISGITQTSYKSTVLVDVASMSSDHHKPKVVGTTPTPPPRNIQPAAPTPSPLPPASTTATLKVDASYELPKTKPLKDSEMAKLPSVRDLRMRFGGSALSPSSSRSNSPNTNGHSINNNKLAPGKLSNGGADPVNGFKVKCTGDVDEWTSD